ncbi:uncharacterized protein LOC143913564 [Arctopsyche grandis]|uniref:uncharacterized protein LOC143913564 n=1 Tax=Arctopsyche grandis TaxID=121162 RepID=UPI00406D65C1
MERRNIFLLSAILFICLGGTTAFSTNSLFKGRVHSRNITEDDCKTVGFICDECKASYYCVPSSSGNFTLEMIEDCEDAGTTCLENTGKCTSQTNLKCNSSVTEYEFSCHQVGLFPDPFECQKYHLCTETTEKSVVPKPQTYECPQGYAYNPLTTMCSKKIVNATTDCKPLIVPCDGPGQSGGVQSHPNMYYLCLPSENKLYYPQLYLCPNGWEYFNDNCFDPYPPTGLDQNGKCIATGLFFNPADCKRYFQCPSVGGSPVSYQCTVGTKFDFKQKRCVEFTCQ